MEKKNNYHSIAALLFCVDVFFTSFYAMKMGKKNLNIYHTATTVRLKYNLMTNEMKSKCICSLITK